jgi:hypothetical protein
MLFPERRADKEIDLSQLEPREFGRMKWMAKNKVNYVSGTMSPADKKGDVLESLQWALEYYKGKGYDEVMLQKKYMGSRCNLYIHEDLDKCYAVSRNGFLIRPDRIDLKEVFCSNRFRYMFQKENKIHNVEYIVLDGELMPWSVLDLLTRHTKGCLHLLKMKFTLYTTMNLNNVLPLCERK